MTAVCYNDCKHLTSYRKPSPNYRTIVKCELRHRPGLMDRDCPDYEPEGQR